MGVQFKNSGQEHCQKETPFQKAIRAGFAAVCFEICLSKKITEKDEPGEVKRIFWPDSTCRTENPPVVSIDYFQRVL